MKTSYVLSGIDREKGFYENQIKYLKKDIKNNSTITFISSTFNDIEKSNRYYNATISWFNNINISFKETYLINSEIDSKTAKEYINKSDIAFIMGGDTLEQIRNIKEYDIIPDIQNKDFIIGISAGSINMAQSVAIARDIHDNIPEHSFYEGIGITNINIEPHFDLNNIEHNKDIIEISKDNKIICLPDETFIRMVNNNIEVIGDYYIYDKKGVLHKNEGI